eukprot:4217511-Pyramimonas_sp.AAC.1
MEATPVEELYAVPTQMISENSALVTIAEEKARALASAGQPTGHPRNRDIPCPIVFSGRG